MTTIPHNCKGEKYFLTGAIVRVFLCLLCEAVINVYCRLQCAAAVVDFSLCIKGKVYCMWD